MLLMIDDSGGICGKVALTRGMGAAAVVEPWAALARRHIDAAEFSYRTVDYAVVLGLERAVTKPGTLVWMRKATRAQRLSVRGLSSLALLMA